MTQSQLLGNWAEQKAADFLLKHDYQIIKRNYHCRYGEIDIIALCKNNLIFVEVKARSSTNYGYASEMVSHTKQKKIIKTAMQFLQSFEHFSDYDCRFDVICLQIRQQFAKTIQQHFHTNDYDLEWLENAFTLDE